MTSHSTRLPCVVLVAVLVLDVCSASSQEPFRALSARDSVSYRFDFERNFFSANEVAREHRDLLSDLERLERAALAPLSTPAALATLLRLEDDVTRRLVRYQAYLSLRTLINSTDADASRLLGEVSARGAGPIAAVQQRIAEVDAAVMAGWLRDDAELRRYEFAIRQSMENRRRGVTAAWRIQALNPQAASWGPQLFRRMLREIDFGQVRDSSGRTFDVRTEMNAIRNHRERAVREAGFRANLRGTATREDTFAHILNTTAAMLHESARRIGAVDFAALTYEERFLTPQSVHATLRAIAATAATNRRYEQLRAARIRSELRLDSVHTWDLTAPRGIETPRFTIDDARRTILAAMQPLGLAYVREMTALLDPANGRMDLIPRANRVERPGFSTGMVGFPSMFFQGRFDGFTEDVVILTHEAGHAVQNMLMDSAGVLPRYAQGASYMVESFGLFSELLTLDHLARTSTGARRIFFLERLLDQASDLYRNSWESAFEQAVFDSVSAGRNLDARALETLAQRIASEYSSWHGPNSERRYAWVNPIQLYTWPLYRVNYVYGKLLALAYYDELTRAPADFQRKYNALLSGAYDAPPAELLSRSMGIEFTPDKLAARAQHVIEQWIRQLEAEYAASGARSTGVTSPARARAPR
jgi:oligoendopeptidase F